MKKAFTLLFILSIFSWGKAQTQRTVLVEHFTQASCGPCAAVNPGFQSILDQNSDKVISIRFQTSWPGQDPMNEHNPGDVQSRVNFYGVSAVPNSVLDGFGPLSTNTGITTSTINSRHQITSPFSINLIHNFSDNLNEVMVTMEITAEEDLQGDVVAHIGIIEEEIHFTSAPGSNGERDFYNVMKKMLPSASGTQLKSNWSKGETETISVSWKLENVYDLREIGVVAYLQNPGSKGIYQAAKSPANLVLAGPNDAIITTASGTGDFEVTQYCGAGSEPIITLRNGGYDVLSSVDIRYRINNGALATYMWSGNLSSLETEEVRLPYYAYTSKPQNIFEAWVENPNEEDDDFKDNDYISDLFSLAPQVETEGIVEVRIISEPDKVTWQLLDEEENEIASGGPYTNRLTRYKTPVSMEKDKCYHLVFKNRTDGFNGYGKLLDNDNQEQLRVDLTGNTDLLEYFGTFDVLGTSREIENERVMVIPNPVEAFCQIEFITKQSTKLELSVFNALGQSVHPVQTYDLVTGEQMIHLNTSNLTSGLYFIRMNTASGIITQSFIKQ